MGRADVSGTFGCFITAEESPSAFRTFHNMLQQQLDAVFTTEKFTSASKNWEEWHTPVIQQHREKMKQEYLQAEQRDAELKAARKVFEEKKILDSKLFAPEEEIVKKAGTEKKKKRNRNTKTKGLKFNFHLPSPRNIRSVLTPKSATLRTQLENENWGADIPKTPRKRFTTRKSVSPSTVSNTTGTETRRANTTNQPRTTTKAATSPTSASNTKDGHLQSLKERLDRLKAEDNERKKRNLASPIKPPNK